tara:strand:- start:413 stop:853 length:441 start_codon:yes stop_codon:yes gene_type:complete
MKDSKILVVSSSNKTSGTHTSFQYDLKHELVNPNSDRIKIKMLDLIISAENETGDFKSLQYIGVNANFSQNVAFPYNNLIGYSYYSRQANGGTADMWLKQPTQCFSVMCPTTPVGIVNFDIVSYNGTILGATNITDVKIIFEISYC